MLHDEKVEQQVWQKIWDKCKNLSNATTDLVFETLVEEGWDVQDDKVIKPEDRKL